MRSIKPIPIELQAGLRIAPAASIQKLVADGTHIACHCGKAGIQNRRFAVGRIGVPLDHRAGAVGRRRDIKIGVLQKNVLVAAGVVAHGHRIDVLRGWEMYW